MKRVLLLALLGLCVMAPVTGGGPGGSPQVDCDDATSSKVLYDITTGAWSCGVDQGGGATWGFGTISAGGNAVADVGGDTLNVNDSSSINFTASNGPPDALTAEAICTSPISCPPGSAITTSISTDRLLGRTTAGSGVIEEIDYDPLYLVLSGGTLSVNDGDIVLWSIADTDSNGYINNVDYSFGTACVDANGNLTCELTSNAPGTAGATVFTDVNEDATSEVVIGTTALLSLNQIRSGGGIGVGDPTQATATNRYTVGNSACAGRDTTANVDRLFEDKNCNFPTTTTPEAGEGMLTDIIAKLTADHTITNAGPTAGTQVTGLKLDLDGLTAYEVIYNILSQSSDPGTGLAYGVTFTGTATLNCERRYAANAAQTIASGVGGPLTEEVWITNAASTTTPNLGPNTGGVQTANTTAHEMVMCLVVVTAAGDLQFWHANEAAGVGISTSVMTNSTARAVRIN